MSESYPTWYAGEDITADKLNSGFPVVARKTADQTKTSNATAAADTELFFSVAANAVYIMDGWIKYDSASAADILIDWSAPSGSLGEWTGWGIGLGTTAATTNGYSIRVETNDLTNSRSFAGIGVGSLATIMLKGTLRTGSTAGTYSMDWAQGTSDATNTTIYTDSWIRLQRIA